MRLGIDFLRKENFNIKIVNYEDAWITADGDRISILRQDVLDDMEEKEGSWSAEVEEIHEEPTKDGWIDVYERQKVSRTLEGIFLTSEKNGKRLRILELGASSGYMISALKQKFPTHDYIAADLFADGLKRSYRKDMDIMHIQCDCTEVPIADNSVHVVYALNMLEHIANDEKAIAESYRILDVGGYCLYVVPRGEKLYDYFDEMLFHKRRYAKGELRKKIENAGFEIVTDFHFAWVCYPAFWLKKKWNRLRGKNMEQTKKMQAVEADIKNATSSSLAKILIKVETVMGNIVHPPFGVREFILCKK